MFSHLVMWLINRDMKHARHEQGRGFRIIYAARTATSGDLDESTAAAVAGECRSWVLANGLSSPQSGRFLNEVSRWTGNSFAVFGAVEVTNSLGDRVRNWYVAELNAEFKVVFGDMVAFDPNAVALDYLKEASQQN
jgi:hypothetical protein